MGNLTLNERVDMLEVIVRGFVVRMEGLEKRVGELKQPVVIEKIKYRNRAKPLKPKRREGLRPGFDKILLDKDGMPDTGE